MKLEEIKEVFLTQVKEMFLMEECENGKIIEIADNNNELETLERLDKRLKRSSDLMSFRRINFQQQFTQQAVDNCDDNLAKLDIHKRVDTIEKYYKNDVLQEVEKLLPKNEDLEQASLKEQYRREISLLIHKILITKIYSDLVINYQLQITLHPGACLERVVYYCIAKNLDVKFVIQLLKFIDYQMENSVRAEHQWTFQDLSSKISAKGYATQYEKDLINQYNDYIIKKQLKKELNQSTQ
jgi:hypothetical protein